MAIDPDMGGDTQRILQVAHSMFGGHVSASTPCAEAYAPGELGGGRAMVIIYLYPQSQGRCGIVNLRHPSEKDATKCGNPDCRCMTSGGPMDRKQIAEELIPQKLVFFTSDPEDPETLTLLEEITVGVKEAMLALKPLTHLEPNTYRLFERLDVVTNGQVAKLLNDNGFCNSTVCPGCRVDDFTHIEGCKVGFGEQ